MPQFTVSHFINIVNHLAAELNSDLRELDICHSTEDLSVTFNADVKLSFMSGEGLLPISVTYKEVENTVYFIGLSDAIHRIRSLVGLDQSQEVDMYYRESLEPSLDLFEALAGITYACFKFDPQDKRRFRLARRGEITLISAVMQITLHQFSDLVDVTLVNILQGEDTPNNKASKRFSYKDPADFINDLNELHQVLRLAP